VNIARWSSPKAPSWSLNAARLDRADAPRLQMRRNYGMSRSGGPEPQPIPRAGRLAAPGIGTLLAEATPGEILDLLAGGTLE
jgi:hypothetical protein